MNKKNLIIETQPGDTFSVVCKQAILFAILNECNCEFEFNGVTVVVNGSSDVDKVYRDYSNSWTMEWKTIGPEYYTEYPKELQKELTEKHAIIEAKQATESAEYRRKEQEQKMVYDQKVSGIIFDVVNSEGYEAQKAKNLDPYGKCCMDYAESWGRLMQYEIAKGNKLEDIASETSHQLGFYGITGFMYGAAVGVLSNHWKHGEALRKWHNKKYGHEGNGVVNPAILTIGSN